MRTPQPLPDGAAERLAAMLKEAKSKADYQRIQCVWMRAALGLRAAQIAVALGWQVGSVRQIHSDYLRQGEGVLWGKPLGGRHRQNLTLEQERDLLTPFLEQAAAGGRACGSPSTGCLRGHRRPSGPPLRRLPGAASPRLAQDHAAPQASEGERRGAGSI